MLISTGHTDVWRYGYSFFQIACESIQEFQKQIQMIILSALLQAIGLSLGDKATKAEIEKSLNK